MEQKLISTSVRHPIKAAKLLYSVPGFILRGPIYLVFLIFFTLFLYSFWAKKDELVIAPLSLAKETTVIESIGSGQVIDVKVEENNRIKANDILVRVQEKLRAIIETEQETFDSKIYGLEKERDKFVTEYSYNLAQLNFEYADLKSNRETKRIAVQGKIDQLKERLKTVEREKEHAYPVVAQASISIRVPIPALYSQISSIHYRHL